MNISQSPKGFGQTPSSNTGSLQLSVDNLPPNLSSPSFVPISKPKPKFSTCIDWLQGVACTSRNEFDFVLGEIGNICQDVFDIVDQPLFSGRNFAHSRRSPKGGLVAWNFLDDGRIDWWLCLPATMLRGCPVFLLRRLLKFLLEMDFKATRIDLAIDDYTKSLSKDDFITACDNDLHHGFQSYGEQWQKTRKKPKGWTFYMGSFGSDKLYRLYDKSVESDGVIDSIRLEAQLRDTFCIWVMQYLLESKTDSQFLHRIASLTYNGIDFYAGKRDKKDYQVCQWWEDFKVLIDADDVQLLSGRTKTTIEKSMEWVEKSVERTLATIQEFYSELHMDFSEYLNARLESGRAKIRSMHSTQVKSALLDLGINDSVSYDDILNGYF